MDWFWFGVGFLIAVGPWGLARIKIILANRRERERRHREWVAKGAPLVAGSVRISQELREELDQKPAWWDRQFHKLLEYIPGQRVMGEEVIVEYDFHGNTSHYWPNQYLRDCICERCHAMRLMYGSD